MSRSFVADAPIAPIAFGPPAVAVEKRADGTIYLRNPNPLALHPPHVLAMLAGWASERPDQSFLAQRGADGAWRRVSYAQAEARAAGIAQALLDRGHTAARPIAILSDNSIEHGLLMLGAMRAGIAVMPVSPAYSLMSADHEKLKGVIAHHDPSAIFVQDAGPFAASLAAIEMSERALITAEQLAEWYRTSPGEAAAAALAAIGPDTIAKILLTSGSTGLPKGVINTQRMLTANQKMAEIVWLPKAEEPPVTLDWLPWHHTFGGNYNLHGALRLGGTMYLDAGRPVAGMFEQTIRNLRDLSPTGFANVPVGFAMLAPVLEKDAGLRGKFFERLKLLGYGGASLPTELWQRMQDLAVATVGERIVFTCGWGSTETAPTATSLHWAIEGAGVIGAPLPGVEIKLVPVGSKYELRVRGPIVTPGYLQRPDLTAAAFDAEGFYRIGDAGRFVDPADANRGLAFDGRVVEDFKLDTGTWVGVGALRLKSLDAAAPGLQDAVVTGHDKAWAGLLAWPNLAACAALCRDAQNAKSAVGVVRDAGVIEHVRRGLAAHNAQAGGSSERIARVLLMAEPASMDAGELTDKGYVNQRATLERRAALVDALYAEPPGEGVVVVE